MSRPAKRNLQETNRSVFIYSGLKPGLHGSVTITTAQLCSQLHILLFVQAENPPCFSGRLPTALTSIDPLRTTVYVSSGQGRSQCEHVLMDSRCPVRYARCCFSCLFSLSGKKLLGFVFFFFSLGFWCQTVLVHCHSKLSITVNFDLGLHLMHMSHGRFFLSALFHLENRTETQSPVAS